MLLVIDIGNTNITIGVYQEHQLLRIFRMTTKWKRTSDEYGLSILNFLKVLDINPKQIDDVIISSVVPKIMHSFNNSIIKYLNKIPMEVGPGIKTGIAVQIDDPKSLGADRLVDAVAAYNIYGGPCLVIDFGTATTYDYINENAVFEGGATSPGIEISAQALWSQAAKLPEIEIKKPDKIISKTTIASMQSGLIFGYIGQTEYLIKRIKEEKASDMKVIATGGLGKIIYESTNMIDVYDRDLTFKGLKIIYEKNK
jgi:pantothenate kinase, type III